MRSPKDLWQLDQLPFWSPLAAALATLAHQAPSHPLRQAANPPGPWPEAGIPTPCICTSSSLVPMPLYCLLHLPPTFIARPLIPLAWPGAQSSRLLRSHRQPPAACFAEQRADSASCTTASAQLPGHAAAPCAMPLRWATNSCVPRWVHTPVALFPTPAALGVAKQPGWRGLMSMLRIQSWRNWMCGFWLPGCQ